MITKEDSDDIRSMIFASAEEKEIVDWLLKGEVPVNNWPSIAVYLEQQQEITIVTPLCLSHLNKVFEQATQLLEQEVYLRILLIIGKQLGKLWTFFRNNSITETYTFKDCCYLIKGKDLKENDPEVVSVLWSLSMDLFQMFNEQLSRFSTESFIVKGIQQEVLMIVNMLHEQERTIFTNEFIGQSKRLSFRKIKFGDEPLLENNLTRNVGKFLSIDEFFHPLLTQEYIKQSVMEMEVGTCLVLIAENEKSEFIGCCTLNDINYDTTEIGLWIKESEQRKGFGMEILEFLIGLIKNNITTNRILYTIEEENSASIALCQHFNFKKTDTFILEPNPLKNKYREMIQFSLEV